MNRSSGSLWLCVAGALAIIATGAQAQTYTYEAFSGPDRPLAPGISVVRPALPGGRCSEGRTIDGHCVDPALALAARDRAIVSTQPRLSAVAPPRVLPSVTITSDRVFR